MFFRYCLGAVRIVSGVAQAYCDYMSRGLESAPLQEAKPDRRDLEFQLTNQAAALVDALETTDEVLPAFYGNLETTLKDIAEHYPNEKIPGLDEAVQFYYQAGEQLGLPPLVHLEKGHVVLGSPAEGDER